MKKLFTHFVLVTEITNILEYEFLNIMDLKTHLSLKPRISCIREVVTRQTMVNVARKDFFFHPFILKY